MLFKELKPGERFRVDGEVNGRQYFHLERTGDGKTKIVGLIRSTPERLKKALKPKVGSTITVLPNTPVIK